MSTSAKGRDESAAQVGAVTSVPRALRLEEEARGAQPSLPRAPRRQSAVHRAPTPSVTPPRGQLPPHEALKAVFQNHRRFLRSFLSLRARGRAASPPPRHPDRDPRESRCKSPGRFPRSPGDPAAVRPRVGTAPRPGPGLAHRRRLSFPRSRAGTMSAETASGPTQDQVEILEYNFNKVNKHPDPTTLLLIAAEAGLSEEETQVRPRAPGPPPGGPRPRTARHPRE